MTSDLEKLLRFGKDLDFRPAGYSFKCPGLKPGGLIIPATRRDFLISSLLKVRSKTRGLVLVKPNRAQIEYSQRCSKRNIVLKARQLGMTTYVAARFFIQTITQPGTLTVQVAHDRESAEEIFKIVRRFWENLPGAMHRGVLFTSHANVRQLVFPKIDSEYRIETADENAGRGLTIHNLHCSEVARWTRGGEEALASLRAAVPPSGEIILESTPNGAGGVFYDEWQRADETGYIRHFFPWWYDEHYKVDLKKVTMHPLTPEEEELVQRHGLSNEQIAWRRTVRATARGLAEQEYAEDDVTWFRASGECVFDVEAIEHLQAATGEPHEMFDNRRLQVWFPPQPSHQYIIGVDPAGGGSEGDYSCAEVIQRRTGMQCAELHGHFPPRELASKVAELAGRYNQALVAVERNNHGHAVLANLQSLECPNVYRHKDNQEGWLTTAASRPAMIENLAAVVAAEPMMFHSPLFLGECRTFVRHPDGSSAAAAGAHDDCVMAMAVAFAVRQAVAGNLSHQGMLELTSLSPSD